MPLHQARVLVTGTDATIVTYGPLVATALAAARVAEQEGTSIEVIDLRSISPMDFDTVETSVRKTGRLIVGHEAPVFFGPGAELAARITERCFYHLQAPSCGSAASTPLIHRPSSRSTTCRASTGSWTPSIAPCARSDLVQ